MKRKTPVSLPTLWTFLAKFDKGYSFALEAISMKFSHMTEGKFSLRLAPPEPQQRRLYIWQAFHWMGGPMEF